MTEKILRIEELDYYEIKNRYYCGFKITTTKQEILFVINEGRACCEEYGYIVSEDNLDEFIGAEIISIERVDKHLEKTKVKLKSQYIDLDGLDAYVNIIFININTSNGLLQFTVYNDHNGYYGHEVYIKINDRIETELL